MKDIQFTLPVMVAGKAVTAIKVAPLTFVDMATVWRGVSGSPGRPEVALQRARMLHQTTFMAGPETLEANATDFTAFPATVAKEIIKALDLGGGEPGKVVGDGDGVTSPAIYKLGTPITFTTNGEAVEINELEFFAKTYGELEDLLATDGDIDRTLALLRMAKPLGHDLMVLPGWAMDRITTADGITLMRKILPLF